MAEPPSRIGFGRFAFRVLRKQRHRFDHVIVQGQGLAALAANLVGRVSAIPTTMLASSPVKAYYRFRKIYRDDEDKLFHRHELMALRLIARVKARLESRYVVLNRYLASMVQDHGTSKPVHVVPAYDVDAKIFSPTTEKSPRLNCDAVCQPPGQSLSFLSGSRQRKMTRRCSWQYAPCWTAGAKSDCCTEAEATKLCSRGRETPRSTRE